MTEPIVELRSLAEIFADDTNDGGHEFEEWDAEQRKTLSEGQYAAWLKDIKYGWSFSGRPKQFAPPGDWSIWVVRAGRAWGKSKTGAEWVHGRAMAHPGRWMALIGKTSADVRDVCIEGPSGLLKCGFPEDRPLFEPSKRRVTWPNGSWATVYVSEDPDMIRGFSGDTAWIDEFCKFSSALEVFQNLQFGMRELSNDKPRILITTTPRPMSILEKIEAQPTTVTVIGSSYENVSNLAPEFFDQLKASYEGTELGRQEIYADILSDARGRVYSSFSAQVWPAGNIDPNVKDIGGDILVGIDFNVLPMSAVIAQRVVDECHVLDAIELKSSNTESLAAEIRKRYPKRKIIACPDPAGNYRHTSQRVGQTDFAILRNAGFEVRAPKAHCLVVDRVNNTQSMLLQGERRRLRIHPRATPLIRSYKGLCYDENTGAPDKGSGLEHVCDAADYLTWQEFQTLIPRGGVSFMSLSI